MNILVIDGQGGQIGARLISALSGQTEGHTVVAVGTNSIATAAMLKAGADYGATGENPCIVNAQDSDIIIGPIGIVLANSLLGEITPAIAAAIGASKAYKILIPVNRCNHHIVGCKDSSLGEYIRMVCQQVDELLAQ